MPNMDGIEMSTEIIKKNSLQAIIITTAYNEMGFLTKAIDIGISGFITKPINNIQFVNVLYKVSLAISDRRFVEEHVHQMEEMTIKLEEQNKELTERNLKLEKSLRILDTMVHKEQMTHTKKEIKTETQIIEENYIKEQITYLINEDLHELIELQSEVDMIIINILNSIDSIEINSLKELARRFSKYGSILSHYNFFNKLSVEMSSFSKILKDEPLPDDKRTVNYIFTLLETFMFVLGKWHDDLASGEETKINALDASITSDMHTISNMWLQVESDTQDIFDF